MQISNKLKVLTEKKKSICVLKRTAAYVNVDIMALIDRNVH